MYAREKSRIPHTVGFFVTGEFVFQIDNYLFHLEAWFHVEYASVKRVIIGFETDFNEVRHSISDQ